MVKIQLHAYLPFSAVERNGQTMINIVVATHGDLSESLLHCAYMIAGGSGLPGIYSLCMREGKGVDEYLADAQAIIDKAPSKDFILLVDLMSASPCNFTLSGIP